MRDTRDSITGASTDILLVLMPYASVERASLAIGSLASGLRCAGLDADSDYPNLRFADLIGLDAYESINTSPIFYQIGEWSFSQAAFPGADMDTDGYLSHLEELLPIEGLAQRLEAVQRAATWFVDRTARDILARGARIVGASTVFQQNNASLALLRRIKALDPTVVTLLGGGNCEGRMGWTLHQQCDFVDYTVSGEADALLAPLCTDILTGAPDLPSDGLPPGVFGPAHRGRPAPPDAALYARVADMSQVALPDFDPYFDGLSRTGFGQRVVPGLPVEAARGCWWGQKHHCTFCGISTSGMHFRAKTSAQFRPELDTLSDRYGVTRMSPADNIVEPSYFKSFLPDLAASDRRFDIFFQTKANLKRAQLEALAGAGVRWLQPGIEALSDEMLALLTKGASMMINLQFLKWARQEGIWLLWHILNGAPGEQDDWYAETAAWLPLVPHFQPPSSPGMNRIRFNRFSPYAERPDTFGLTLEPAWAYAHTYPFSRDVMRDLAYYFSDREMDVAALRGDGPGTAAMPAAIGAWYHGFTDPSGPIPVLRADAPTLTAHATSDGWDVTDTRPVRVADTHRLGALDVAILRACDACCTQSAVHKRLSDTTTPADVQARIDALVDARLILRRGDLILSLVFDRAPRAYPAPHRFPPGFLSAAPLHDPQFTKAARRDTSLADLFA